MSRRKTVDEQAVIKAVKAGVPRKEVAAKYGVSIITVNGYCQRNGIKSHVWISAEEKQIIRDMCEQGKKVQEIADAIGRSAQAVIGIRQRLGLSQPKRRPNDENIAKLNELVQSGKSVSEAARMSNMSPNTAVYYLDHDVQDSTTTISKEDA